MSLFKGVVEIKTTEDGQSKYFWLEIKLARLILSCFSESVADYKRTLCPYFKAGVCEKGKKCKYSHDMSVEDQKMSNIDIYQDPRQKLGTMPDTIITCRDFIEAVEKNLYGFNWVCPNGADKCQYRHMLPAGYVLDKDKKGDANEESDEDEIPLEEQIEAERAELKHEDLTPVTLETFLQWKKDRAAKKAAELEAKIKAEEAKGKKDKSQMAFMSGRALFTYNPELFQDEEGATTNEGYEEEDPALLSATQDTSQAAAAEKEEVKVDEGLFADDAADADEDVDFD